MVRGSVPAGLNLQDLSGSDDRSRSALGVRDDVPLGALAVGQTTLVTTPSGSGAVAVALVLVVVVGDPDVHGQPPQVAFCTRPRTYPGVGVLRCRC